MSSSPTTKKSCDICWHSPGKFRSSMTFLECRMCHVTVHAECYGVHQEENDDNTVAANDFQCWACAAIGTEVTVRSGKKFTVAERPTACCLCSVDDGREWYHAMHPIYDDSGLTGRHAVVVGKNNEEELAWAHTLCCSAININPETSGCVYGCTQVGHYVGEEDVDDHPPRATVNPHLEAGDPLDTTIHHFVFCTTLRGENSWTKRILDAQTLKCFVCGKVDEGTMRIAVQCCSNDPHEMDEFKKKHQDQNTCYVAMHIGCAMWSRNLRGQCYPYRRVFFFPGISSSGEQDEQANGVLNTFCNTHIMELIKGGLTGAAKVKYPPHIPVANATTLVEQARDVDFDLGEAKPAYRSGPKRVDVRASLLQKMNSKKPNTSQGNNSLQVTAASQHTTRSSPGKARATMPSKRARTHVPSSHYARNAPRVAIPSINLGDTSSSNAKRSGNTNAVENSRRVPNKGETAGKKNTSNETQRVSKAGSSPSNGVGSEAHDHDDSMDVDDSGMMNEAEPGKQKETEDKSHSPKKTINETIKKKMIDEIMLLEESQHLAVALRQCKKNWKESSHFEGTWESARDHVIQELGYSANKTNWDSLEGEPPKSTLEVLWEGVPPVPLEDGDLLRMARERSM